MNGINQPALADGPAAGQAAITPSGEVQPGRYARDATVTVTLADGEARTATVTTADGGSYACPWCGSPVSSPQAWEQAQQSSAALAERLGEPARPPVPYPGSQAAAWSGHGCASPGCPASMTAGQLAAYRQREAARAGHRRQQEHLQQWHLEQNAKRQREEEELWQRLAAEAARRACLRCLHTSAWRTGSPRLVRHRDPRHHDAQAAGGAS